MTKSAEPSTPSGSSETQQRRRQITSYKNTTTSPATDSPVTEESAKETVKTIARGMPGESGVTVVTNARVYYPPRAAAGASGTRHSLRSLQGGRNQQVKPRVKLAARSRSCVRRHCLRQTRRFAQGSASDEPSHSCRARCCMDCFACARNDGCLKFCSVKSAR